jgi:hypothetical protein
MVSTAGLSRTVVAPLSSAIIALMLAGVVVVGVDQVGQSVQPGEARLVPDGTVEVALDGGEFVTVENKDFREVLDGDDRVRVTNGSAVLELADDVRVELRAGSSVALGGPGADLRLESGDLLVEARDARFNVDGGLAMMTVDGVAKLRRAVSLVSGVYEGKVLMRSGADALTVGRYRQAAAAGTGILPQQVDPLRLDPEDKWDQRILPKVIDLDTKLVRFGRDFETTLPAGLAVGPELFRQVVPDLSDEPITPTELAGRAPGENLIGFVLVSHDMGSFQERYNNIFGFRSQGASWGLIAADRDLSEVPVLNGMEFALGFVSGSGGVVAETPRGEAAPVGTGGTNNPRTGGARPGPAGTPTGPPNPSTTPSTQPSPGTTNPGPTDPGTTPSPGGTPPGQTPPPDPKVIDVPPLGIPAVDNLLQPVIDPVENLLDGVLDGLLGLGAASSPTPTSSGGKLLQGLLGG